MIQKILKWIWIAAVLYVLGETLYGYSMHPNSGIEVIATLYMLFLTFPAGLLVVLFYMACAKLSLAIPLNYVSIGLTWVAFVVVGYWQWFVWLPRLQRKYDALVEARQGDGNKE